MLSSVSVGEGLKNFGAFQEKMGKQLRAEQAERAEKAGGAIPTGLDGNTYARWSATTAHIV